MHHHYIDRLAYGDSPIHRLDPRGKIIAVLAYTAVLISVPKYNLLALAPFAVLPFAMITLGAIPWRFVLKHTLIVSPLIICLALANPLWDRTARPLLGPVGGPALPGGWLIAGTILCKFAFGMAALIALTSTTRFADLTAALQRLRLPRPVSYTHLTLPTN